MRRCGVIGLIPRPLAFPFSKTSCAPDRHTIAFDTALAGRYRRLAPCALERTWQRLSLRAFSAYPARDARRCSVCLRSFLIHRSQVRITRQSTHGLSRMGSNRTRSLWVNGPPAPFAPQRKAGGSRVARVTRSRASVFHVPIKAGRGAWPKTERTDVQNEQGHKQQATDARHLPGAG